MTVQANPAPQYFWVNQGKTFKEERELGIIWAPQVNADGSSLAHWKSVLSVKPGDIVFSYAKAKIVAVSLAVAPGIPVDGKPLKSGQWADGPGFQAELAYQDLETPITKQSLIKSKFFDPKLAGHMLASNGNIKQTYLSPLTDVAGERLLRLLGLPLPGAIASSDKDQRSVITQCERLVQARVGQGKFRDDVLKLWNDACPVTGVQNAKLLRASHIKPWAKSENVERLDPENGILLAAHVDAAFDCGLISFADDGQLIVSNKLSANDRMAIGVQQFKQPKFSAAAKAYLAYHRERFGLN